MKGRISWEKLPATEQRSPGNRRPLARPRPAHRVRGTQPAKRPWAAQPAKPPCGRAWEIDSGPAGTESLLLLARETPLPADSYLAACFCDLSRQTADHLDGLVAFADGAMTPDAANPDRGPVLSKASPINDSVLQTQRVIADRLRPLFPLCGPSPFRWLAANRSEIG